MLAAHFAETGGSDVLRIGEVEVPEPGPGEVRVRVTVSGVNPTDWKARSGASGVSMTPFRVPNQDGAGVIDAVGDGVDAARVGERVWVFFAAWQRRWGTAAQWTVVPAEHAVELPAGASDELGASLGIPAMTAHRCLAADGPIEGSTVLVSGGAGAVGHAAIELARWMGARVVATASTDEKAALAEAAGAHAVVRYRDADAAEQLRAAAPDGVDRVIEVALGANLDLDLSAANSHATIVTYADDGDAAPVLPIRPLMVPNIVLRFVLVYSMGADAVRAAADGVKAAVAAGALTPLPLHRFPLERTAAAHDAVQAGAIGKVLIDVP
ncbi:MAG: NADPH:quinone reductase [Solirubrobacteraceae bacterium]|jgi:NADPH2:quinone reductase|nr:NADPH:quinone reductase [Solirubrobacteraceae bacterium]